MSTLSPHFQAREQRLRGGCADNTPPPGSRKRAPWILRSKRGSPHTTPHTRPGLIAQERRTRVPRHVPSLQAKTAASSLSALRPNTPHLPLLASRRDAGRETVPPSFPSACTRLHVMPP